MDSKTELWTQFLIFGSVLFAAAPQAAAQKKPLIWMSPKDSTVAAVSLSNSSPTPGSLDFLDLFSASSPWTNVQSHADMFSFHDIAPAYSDAQWTTIIAALKRSNIAFAVEPGV